MHKNVTFDVIQNEKRLQSVLSLTCLKGQSIKSFCGKRVIYGVSICQFFFFLYQILFEMDLILVSCFRWIFLSPYGPNPPKTHRPPHHSYSLLQFDLPHYSQRVEARKEKGQKIEKGNEEEKENRKKNEGIKTNTCKCRYPVCC